MNSKIADEINEFLGGAVVSDSEVLGGYAANYSIGGTLLHNIRSNIIEWKYCSESCDDKKKIKIVNDILNLSQPINNENDLCTLIYGILKLSDAELMEFLVRNLKIKEPLEIALRKLYYVWKDLIDLIVTIAELGPGSEYVTTTLPGYCPYEPVTRIIALFKFPLDKVINIIREKNKSFMIEIDLDHIYSSLKDIKPDNKKLFKFSKPVYDTSNKNIKVCMDHIMEIYKIAYPGLVEQEKYYIDQSKKIIEICAVIEGIIIKLI
jgi:hypothetical protein